MVLLALTKRGMAELLDIARDGKVTLWVNQGLLEDSQLEKLRAEGLKLTNFKHWVDPADEWEVKGAVDTIREHHPGESLYVERTWA